MRLIKPDVTFVNAVIVTKADPVRPQHALADADSGHGRWVDNMCESAFAAAHRAKGFTIAASRNFTLVSTPSDLRILSSDPQAAAL
jgi:hypothetical protein